MHPNGQLPAYGWNFNDVNPPVHAWAVWRVFQMDKKCRGDAGDLGFRQGVFMIVLRTMARDRIVSESNFKDSSGGASLWQVGFLNHELSGDEIQLAFGIIFVGLPQGSTKTDSTGGQMHYSKQFDFRVSQ
eukprot:TRINITY_DN12205_c0_g2_i1.p1 TRINITY_DN12205_c0_g2~~TRINITY_DN12205_c0_g2_i1.p1  ORF type:complete len:130 (-),score=9.42 TRINITY_DN12205_c0_g2_i1:96-485(-)